MLLHTSGMKYLFLKLYTTTSDFIILQGELSGTVKHEDSVWTIGKQVLIESQLLINVKFKFSLL